MWPRPPSRQFSGFTVREELLGQHSRLTGVHRHPGCRQPHALQTRGLPCPTRPLGGRVSPCVNGPLAVAFCSALCLGSSLSPEIEGGLAAGRQRSRHERRLSSLHGLSGHPRPGHVLPSPPPAQLDSPGGPAESARKPGVWTCSGLREKRRPNLAAAPLQTLRTVNGARKAAAGDRAAGAAGAGGAGPHLHRQVLQVVDALETLGGEILDAVRTPQSRQKTAGRTRDVRPRGPAVWAPPSGGRGPATPPATAPQTRSPGARPPRNPWLWGPPNLWWTPTPNVLSASVSSPDGRAAEAQGLSRDMRRRPGLRPVDREPRRGRG